MQSFVIGACSTCDLPQDYVDRHEIAIVKYTFTINHKEYKDGDMDAHTFFNMEREGHVATTSQVTPDDYMELFDKVLSSDQDLLYIVFSSGLSGSCNNAKLARRKCGKYPDRKLYVIDSLCASLGQDCWWTTRSRCARKASLLTRSPSGWKPISYALIIGLLWTA